MALGQDRALQRNYLYSLLLFLSCDLKGLLFLFCFVFFVPVF